MVNYKNGEKEYKAILKNSFKDALYIDLDTFIKLLLYAA